MASSISIMLSCTLISGLKYKKNINSKIFLREKIYFKQWA